MATIGASAVTLADWAKVQKPGGGVDKVVQILNETNEVLDDALFMEGNLPTGHRTTVLSGLPTPTWRLLNYGVQPSKATHVQVTDACGMLEDYAEVDKSLADLNGNTVEFRLSQDRPHIEGVSQGLADAIIYGNQATDPEQITGLAPRYNSASAANGGQIINGGGTGSTNTSVWFVTWGDMTAHMIYPKGSMAGLMKTDKGQVTLEDAAGGKYEGYRTHYKWDTGFTLRDWRYCARVANIDVSALVKDFATGADLLDLMIRAYWKIPTTRIGVAASAQAQGARRMAIYANGTVMAWLHRQARKSAAYMLSLDKVEGQPILSFMGVPIRRVDAILNTETAIPFS